MNQTNQTNQPERPITERFSSVIERRSKAELFGNRTIYKSAEIRRFGFWTFNVYVIFSYI